MIHRSAPYVLAMALIAGCASDRSNHDDPQTIEDHNELGLPESNERETPPTAEPAQPEWVALFNGVDLSGWTPKITGFPLGENPEQTFRVEDGLLRVSYDGYESFEGRFGHLFHDGEYGNYDLRIVYRFMGDQVPGGPGWAFRNSGVMLHGQSAASMGVDQDFPVSIEAQFLGGVGGGDERPTGNLCTPGTHVEMNGELKTQHCITADAPTKRDDEWVTMEVQVRGHGPIKHLIDGELVLEYSAAQLDPSDRNAQALLASGVDPMLASGSISLQAESHPIDFKSVEIRVLD